jgi:HNH endonuclease
MTESKYSPYLTSGDWVYQRYVTEGRTDTEIARLVSELLHTNCHRVAVERARKRFGIKSQPRKGRPLTFSQFAGEAGKKFLAKELETKNYTQIAAEQGCSVPTVSEWAQKHGLTAPDRSAAIKAGLARAGHRRGSAHPRWDGGHRVIGNYMFLHREVVEGRWPNHPRLAKDDWTYCQEHILVVEADRGTMLPPGWVVDHKDDDKLNNDLSNLEPHPSQGAHQKRHWREAQRIVWRYSITTAGTPRWRPTLISAAPPAQTLCCTHERAV